MQMVSVVSDPGRLGSQALGMALLTAIMGKAFAAFAEMTAAFGLPRRVQKFVADSAVVRAPGMLSGFRGTLVTAMAANFNIVPAALLKPHNGVIRPPAPCWWGA
jgi:uncharacterized membrane protein